jgi:NAD(P)H-dependent flavin oxidoreductase YrpB (nitropropane dioxygenase family)
MKLQELKIGKFTAKLPIVQGGMSVRNSMAPLAAAVSNAGGIGVIGASGIPAEEVVAEIKKCRELTKGIVAVNIMYAISNFKEVVMASIEAGVDLIFTGAGFSKEIYSLAAGTHTEVVSIVSSAKAGMLAERLGAKALVVEGAEAGGHLGTDRSIDDIFPEVRAAVKNIPVLAAGGIIDGNDIAKYLKMGADGVQMATRFVCSDECSAPLNYKMAYINSKKEDIVEMYSPVGLPGRAIRTAFINTLEEHRKTEERFKDKCPMLCLKTCSRFYCINDRLNAAMQGDLENGLVFSGANAWRVKKIQPVKEIMEELVSEVEAVSA